MIRVRVSARLSTDGRPPSGNVVEAAIKQCVADAIEGSFDEYPSHLRNMLRMRATLVELEEQRDHATYAEARFVLGLPEKLFPVEGAGLQLLVNLLAGDIFPSEVSGCLWTDTSAELLELPNSLQATAFQAFRQSGAHSIDTIRSRFRLPEERPLLAFSLKPRVGPDFKEIQRLTRDVLAEGFNIVELDTRCLALSTVPLDAWLDLGIEAAETGKGGHVTAFSPNLSVPAPKLIDVATEWVEKVSPHGPPVIKVDGGLDGLTSLQSVRLVLQNDKAPIVTSYPLLRNQLASAIGSNGWTDLLALSGADIVYPGGRPTFPNERRPVWGVHAKNWARAARIYDRMIKRGWPMPTIAGGVHPGHLHALYELLGPKVAYFLGGAVALHPQTVRDGAKLCVDVLNKSIDLSRDAEQSGESWSEDLPPRLMNRVEQTKYPNTKLNYFSPEGLFKLTGEEPPKTFYRRG